jgi:hypothetical protein
LGRADEDVTDSDIIATDEAVERPPTEPFA